MPSAYDWPASRKAVDSSTVGKIHKNQEAITEPAKNGNLVLKRKRPFLDTIMIHLVKIKVRLMEWKVTEQNRLLRLFMTSPLINLPWMAVLARQDSFSMNVINPMPHAVFFLILFTHKQNT